MAKVVLRKKSLNNVEGGPLVFISVMSVLMFSFDNSFVYTFIHFHLADICFTAF